MPTCLGRVRLVILSNLRNRWPAEYHPGAAMPIKNKTDSSRPRRLKRLDPDDEDSTPGTSPIALGFLAVMAIVGIACFVIGIVRHGFDWRVAWQAASSLTAGLASSRSDCWNWSGSRRSSASPMAFRAVFMDSFGGTGRVRCPTPIWSAGGEQPRFGCWLGLGHLCLGACWGLGCLSFESVEREG